LMTSRTASPGRVPSLMAAFSLLSAVAAPVIAQTSAGTTYHIIRDITLGGDGRWDYVAVDTAGRRLFIARQPRVLVGDPVSGEVVGTVPLGGKPEFGVTDGQGKLYVNLEDKGEVAEIDPARLRVMRRWSLAPCEEPTGLAIDRVHHLLFSGCHNRIMTI